MEESKRLLDMIKELSEIETNEIEIMIAIFNKKIEKNINYYMKKISEYFSFKCEFYKVNSTDVQLEKDKILKGFQNEFDRIVDRIQEQFINIILELQESQANKMIAIANCKRMLDAKKIFENSKEYENYIHMVEELTYKRDNSEIKKEFDELDATLSNLEDPIITYENKIDVLVEKYGKYSAVEEQCYAILEECNNNIKSTIDSVMKYSIDFLEIPQKLKLSERFRKTMNSFLGSKKFKTEFMKIQQENFKKVQQNTDEVLEEIRNKTIYYIDLLTSYKEKIKQESNKAA